MKQFFDNLSWKLMAFMNGRNGMDTLARWSFWIGFACMAIDIFANSLILTFISWIFVGYSLFRCFSKNIATRALENAKFEALIRGPKAKAARANERYEQRKTKKFFKCQQCGQELSVPKGKGTLRVTCPRCGAQTTMKS